MILDEGPSLQISANLEKILSFLSFWSQNRFSCPTRSATLRALTFERSSGGKLDIFGFFMKMYSCLAMAERFHEVLGGLKGQKHSKNGLSATFCTSRHQSWEIEVLEGQMTSTLKNSTWVGYQTSMAFQRDIMISIWTSGSAPKIGSKWRIA